MIGAEAIQKFYQINLVDDQKLVRDELGSTSSETKKEKASQKIETYDRSFYWF